MVASILACTGELFGISWAGYARRREGKRLNLFLLADHAQIKDASCWRDLPFSVHGNFQGMLVIRFFSLRVISFSDQWLLSLEACGTELKQRVSGELGEDKRCLKALASEEGKGSACIGVHLRRSPCRLRCALGQEGMAGVAQMFARCICFHCEAKSIGAPRAALSRTKVHRARLLAKPTRCEGRLRNRGHVSLRDLRHL